MAQPDAFAGFCPATAHLSACDPDWARLIHRVGPCRLAAEDAREPYEALARAIAHQQIHGRAAEAILGRLLVLVGGAFPSPQQLLALPDSDWRACGFSAAKITAVRGIARGHLEGVVPSRAEALHLTDAELIDRLVTLRGVGRWTVEMLLMFCLGRPDVLPVDDFGVREGWRQLKGLPAQPAPGVLRRIGDAWRPYRSTAAWYLWRAAEAARAAGASPGSRSQQPE